MVRPLKESFRDWQCNIMKCHAVFYGWNGSVLLNDFVIRIICLRLGEYYVDKW